MLLDTILFLHDTTLATPRGAELTIKELIKLGEKRGHTVILDYCKDFEKTKSLISSADVLILNSTSRCTYELELVKHIVQQEKPYIKVEYDYNFCIRRNILCTVDRNIRSCCHPEKFHLFRNLFSNASLNVFQSPKHYQSHYDFYGEAVTNKLIMPPTVTVEHLNISKTKDDSTIPFFGDLNFLKGGHDYITFAEEHPDKKFTVYGSNRLRRKIPENMTFHDSIPNTKVLEILGKSKQFLCKPVWPEPSGRLAAEAFLSGCEILTNDRVGTFSFDFYPNDIQKAKAKMEQAPNDFWEATEKILDSVPSTKQPKLGKVLVYKSYAGLGDIFFAIPSIYKLAAVSEELHFAVAPRLVSFFSKHLNIKVVPEPEARLKEKDYDSIFELGNYPAFKGYNLPHAVRYVTHKKVKQHAIQHYIDSVSRIHRGIDNHMECYPYFERKIETKNPYFVVHHGAGFLLKIWPTEKYASFIEKMAKLYPHLDCKVILGPDDPDIEKYFSKKLAHVQFIKGGMLEVGDAMAGALFHIGNDAGITHVAGAFNVPSVGIYGPTGPGSWGSFAEHNELIWGKRGVCDLRCNYDVILNCEHRICLSSVTVDRVLEALYKVLQRAYPKYADNLVVNPLARFEFTDNDCIASLGENELLLEYHSNAMKKDVERLLQEEEGDFNEEEDIEKVIGVLLQQEILFHIPSFEWKAQ